ncbi:MAG: hypothetical protein K6G26_10160, partial [Lachnospiraceae bacterium]|nr:hypothetical protein [Lachnospiraceae bacterium]
MKSLFYENVKSYYEIVENACERLINDINTKHDDNIINKFDLFEYIRKHHVYEYTVGNDKYRFHGVGCSVERNNDIIIDWDFGYRNWWCGIDPYKMSITLKKSSQYTNKSIETKYIEEECKRMLVEKKMLYYKNQYYFNLLKYQTKIQIFPAVY